MVTKQVRVTPEMAQKWLEGNTHNRTLRQSTVERYARDMKAGRWRLTHQGIAFDPGGVLIDGQHRLWAIFESGVPVEMMVTQGLELAAQEVIDGGEMRQARDVLTLRGESVNPLLVGVAKMLCQQLTGEFNSTRTETVRTFEQHKEAIYFAGKLFPKRVRGIWVAPVVAPLARAYYTRQATDLQKFAQVLCDGMMGDPREQPIITLRNWLMAGNPKRGEIYAKTERALLAYLQGERIKILYAATEELFLLPSEEKRAARRKGKAGRG